MDKSKSHYDTQTAEKNEDCFNVFMQVIDEIKKDSPLLVADIGETTIAKIAVDRQPQKFYLTPKHFLKCVRAHKKVLSQNCPSRKNK